MLALGDQLWKTHGYNERPCIGLGGGIATPQATAAAFAMGAAFVVVGTVNQACVESGTSATVRQLLASARQGDVTMAPSADMFELGVNVQVLKRGTMFSLRAHKLYDLYTRYGGFDEIPAKHRQMVERDILQTSFYDAWEQTKLFFQQRDPSQIDRAKTDPKHKMALVFRSYLGQSSKWAQAGNPRRQMDYQIWCGPAMGAFNQWTQGTFLEAPDQRRVDVVAFNFLLGAAYLTRGAILSHQGVEGFGSAEEFRPLPLDQIKPHLAV
jgi:PfaD family protein